MKSSDENQNIMTSSNRPRASSWAVPVLLGLALAAPQACKSSNASPSDDDNVVNPGGAPGDDDSGSGGKSNTGTGGRAQQGSGGKGSTGSGGADLGGAGPGGEGNQASGGNHPSGGADQGTAGGFVEPPREDCGDEPNGADCWDLTKCNGVSTIQFLEQCSGACVAPFDNEARIEGYTGTLPPLL